MIRAERLDPSALDWSHFLIAECYDEVVGIGQIRPHPKCRELGSLVVKPAYRGTGVGGQLIRALVASVDGDVYLDCRSELETYYNRFGFNPIPWHQAPSPIKYKVLIGNSLFRLFGLRLIVMKRVSTPK
jgi:amino-acid N-acetyltransferase